jgi:hypothetical protein
VKDSYEAQRDEEDLIQIAADLEKKRSLIVMHLS